MSLRAHRQCRPGSHVCEIHSSGSALSAAVMDFVEEGLLLGESVIVIAAPARRRMVERRLEPLFAHLPQPARQRLTLLDSRRSLFRIMRDNSPDSAAFAALVKPVLGDATLQGNGQVRIYGEMVNDLWRDGNARAAVELEALWNELAITHAFALFCGYLLDPFDPRSYSDDLERVCAAHGRVSTVGDDGNALSAIEDACHARLGFSPSSVLTQSQAGLQRWDTGLSRMRRVVFWLLRNVPSATPTILAQARRHVANG